MQQGGGSAAVVQQGGTSETAGRQQRSSGTAGRQYGGSGTVERQQRNTQPGGKQCSREATVIQGGSRETSTAVDGAGE